MGRRRLRISIEMLVNSLKGSAPGTAFRCIDHQLPADAKMVGLSLRPSLNAIDVELQSEAWDMPPGSESGLAPLLEPGPWITEVEIPVAPPADEPAP